MQRPQTRYARRGEVRLAYQVVGDGPIDLVLCDDLCPIDVAWLEPTLARFLRRLASFSRLIYYDKHGTGASDQARLDRLPAIQSWADDVGAVLDEVGSQQAAVLGYASGAQVAAYFAAAHPERVSALVLANGFARLVASPEYPWGFPPRVAEAFIASQEKRWGSGENLPVVAPGHAQDERLREWFGLKERLGTSTVAALAFYRTVLDTDISPILPTIRVPTLVMQTSQNRYIRAGHGRFLAEHIPRAEYVEVPGENHLLHLEEADSLANAIERFLTGTSGGPTRDRVLATVLFTDICGSTERAASLGDRAWKVLLDSHDDVARAEVARYLGREIKTTGDGILATFDGPARAIECARAIMGSAQGLGLELRAGVHTGEIELRGNADIGGLAVHIGARIAALAEPGEVLVSSTVRDLVAGSGITFVDRGGHELKGLPGRWQLLSATR